eukprot:244193_1
MSPPKLLIHAYILLYYLFEINNSMFCFGDCNGVDTCNNYGKCNFTCPFIAECTNQDINCNTGAVCNLLCISVASCNTLTINAGDAELFQIYSMKGGAAASISIYCPNNGPYGEPRCIINPIGTGTLTFQGTDIYAYEGFNDVIINDCTSSRCGGMTMHCDSDDTEPHWLFGWNGPQCSIDTNTYDQCDGDDTKSHACSTYFLPTISPTHRPTNNPTLPTLSPTQYPTMINRANIIVTLFINNSNITTTNVMTHIQQAVYIYLNDTLQVNYTYQTHVILLEADYDNNLYTVEIIISSDKGENIVDFIDEEIILKVIGNKLYSKYGDKIKMIRDTTTTQFTTEISVTKGKTDKISPVAYIVPIVLLILIGIIIVIIVYYHKKKEQMKNEYQVGMELQPGSPQQSLEKSAVLSHNMEGNCIVKQDDDDDDEDMYNGAEIGQTYGSDGDAASVTTGKSNLSLPVSQIDFNENNRKTSMDEDLYERVSIVTDNTATADTPMDSNITENSDV